MALKKTEASKRIKRISQNKKYGLSAVIIGLIATVLIWNLGLTSYKVKSSKTTESNIIQESNSNVTSEYTKEEKELDYKIARENLEGFIKDGGYSNAPESQGANAVIKLPATFKDTTNGLNIGEIMEEANTLLKENNYDFSSYLGKEATFYSLPLADKQGNAMILARKSQVIGLWVAPDSNEDMRGDKIISALLSN